MQCHNETDAGCCVACIEDFTTLTMFLSLEEMHLCYACTRLQWHVLVATNSSLYCIHNITSHNMT